MAVLERGYSIARTDDGTVVRDAANIRIGDRLRLKFARGSAAVRVEDPEAK